MVLAIIVPLAALVAGARPAIVFGLVLLATTVVRPRLAPIAVAVSVFPLLQLIPLPAAFGDRFAEAASLGVDVTPRISIAPHETLLDAAQLAGCVALFFLTRELARRSEHGLLGGAIGLVVIGGWQAVQGIEQYMAGIVTDDVEAIARGAFVHRGHYAALLAGAAAVSVGLATTYLRSLPWLGVAAGAVAGLSLVAAAASLSRLGLVAAVGGVVVAAGALPRRRALLVTVALLAVFGAGTAVVNPERVTRRFEELVEQRGDPGRLAIWRDSITAFEKSPLVGSGLGAFGYAFRRSEMYFPRKSVEHAHSDFLEFVVELGVSGAGMLLLTIGASFVSAVRSVRAEEDDGRRLIRLGCVAGAGAIALCATADFPLHSPAVAAMFAVLLGLAGLCRGDPGLPSGALLPVAWGAAFALIAVVVQQDPAGWNPERHYRDALRLNAFSAPMWLGLAELEMARGRLPQALDLRRMATRVEPLTLRTEWPLAELELEMGQTDRATARLAVIANAIPDLRDAVFQTAWQAGLPVSVIEDSLVPVGAGDRYVAFLARNQLWERIPYAAEVLAEKQGPSWDYVISSLTRAGRSSELKSLEVSTATP